MADSVRVLQIGGAAHEAGARAGGAIDWFRTAPGGAGACAEAAQGAFEAAVLYATPTAEDCQVLRDALMPYTLFYGPDVAREDDEVALLFRQKMAEPLPEEEEPFWTDFALRYWRGQYGDRVKVCNATVSADFHGEVIRYGNAEIVLSGVFSGEGVPLLSFRENRALEPDRALELWPEYEVTEGDVRLFLNIKIFAAGYTDWLTDQVICEANAEEPVVVRAQAKSVLCISYEAAGEGSVRIGPLHVRQSRLGAGCLLPGGKRFADEKRNEFFTYFDPMDCKPPLNVYFSGYRKAEGFEGYHLLRALGAPFLLIADPRVEGGAYYMGSASYEEAIRNEIQKALDVLGFDASKLILSGLSMGTFGALYHGASFSPHAVIAGKLLLNGGQIAKSAAISRPDEFATSLDVLYELTGGCDDAACAALDERMWDRIRSANFTDTTIAVAFMREDDYDGGAYDALAEQLGGEGVRIYGKGITGRHNDNSEAVNQWFVSQYRSVLQEDFGRMLLT